MINFEDKITGAKNKKEMVDICKTMLELPELPDFEKILSLGLESHLHGLIEPLKEVYLDNGDLEIKIMILDFFREMRDLTLSDFLIDQLELPNPVTNNILNRVNSYMFLHSPQTESSELQLYILDALETCGKKEIIPNLEELVKTASNLVVERRAREVSEIIVNREKKRETGKLSVSGIDDDGGHLSDAQEDEG